MTQLDKIVNTRVKKNSLLPIILILSASVLVVSVICVLFLISLLTMLIENKNQSYDRAAEITAATINSEIDGTFGIMEEYIDNYNGTYLFNFRSTNAQLELNHIVEYENCERMMVIEADGSGIDNNGTVIDISQTPVFKRLNPNSKALYAIDGDDTIYFSMPIYDIGGIQCMGYVIVERSSVLSCDSLSVSTWSDSARFFVIDARGTVIGHSEDSTTAPDFETLRNSGMYDPKSTAGNVFNPITTPEESRDYLISTTQKLIAGENFEVWYKKYLKYNSWSVVLGREEVGDTAISNMVGLVFLMFGVQYFCMVLMLIVFSVAIARSNRKLLSLVFLDPVTGGTNWIKFRLDTRAALRRRQTGQSYFVSASITQFSLFSDIYGHEQGEKLLVTIARTIGNSLEKGEFMTRRSNEQFDLWLFSANDEGIAERLIQLEAAIQEESGLSSLKLNFGVYTISRSDKDLTVDRMDIFANIAKDTIKNGSADRIAFYNDEMRNRLLKEKDIENTMEKALENNEFVVYLQPKYSTESETVSGAEALVRWISDEKGFVSPGEFIPVFEKNGFIVKLDDYMLHSVCALQKRWLELGYTLVPISVNVSRANFTNKFLAQHIKNIVDIYEIPYSVIELELTESAFFDDKKVLLNTVKRLRSYGFPVSMDDFGAGYSSLNSLKDLPLDVVKLDGEFFRDSEDYERSKTVIKDTISLAKDLNMRVVAEGIETREQVDFLSKLGCDLIQGFYFAKPMPVDKFEDLQQYATTVSKKLSE